MAWQRVKVVKRDVCFIKNNFDIYSRFRIDMPSGSNFYGYHFLLPTTIINNDNAHFTELNLEDNYEIELIKSERAQGERYSRPKIVGSELISELKKFEANVFDSFEFYLAETTEYSNKGLFKTTNMNIGSIDKNWFYPLDNGERKRRNAYGFKLAMKLDKKGVEDYYSLKKLECRFSKEINASDEIFQKYKDFLQTVHWRRHNESCDFKNLDSAKFHKDEMILYNNYLYETEKITTAYAETVRPYFYIIEAVKNANIGKTTKTKQNEME